MTIYYQGKQHETLRFNQLNALIGDLSQKVLSETLKALEADGFISRKINADEIQKGI